VPSTSSRVSSSGVAERDLIGRRGVLDAQAAQDGSRLVLHRDEFEEFESTAAGTGEVSWLPDSSAALMRPFDTRDAPMGAGARRLRVRPV
jgi:hypothetical protein